MESSEILAAATIARSAEEGAAAAETVMTSTSPPPPLAAAVHPGTISTGPPPKNESESVISAVTDPASCCAAGEQQQQLQQLHQQQQQPSEASLSDLPVEDAAVLRNAAAATTETTAAGAGPDKGVPAQVVLDGKGSVEEEPAAIVTGGGGGAGGGGEEGESLPPPPPPPEVVVAPRAEENGASPESSSPGPSPPALMVVTATTSDNNNNNNNGGTTSISSSKTVDVANSGSSPTSVSEKAQRQQQQQAQLPESPRRVPPSCMSEVGTAATEPMRQRKTKHQPQQHQPQQHTQSDGAGTAPDGGGGGGGDAGGEEKFDEFIRSPEVQNAIVERSPGGRYVRFMEKLGSGASKDVYRAYDTQEGIEVAWNVVNLSGVPKNERNRIVNEVRLLERLHHHNIISFHGSWVNRERQEVNFVTEILSSGTLKSFIAKVQVIRWKIAKRWAVQILNGLAYLHSQEPTVIHRDLKCENIFINGTSGDLRIGDLGLSTVHRNGRVLSVLGTPEFMAPDMYEEGSYDEKVDMYAFGMCMLEIFTKEIPYSECKNPAQIYKKVSSGEPPEVLSRLQSRHAREFVLLCLGYKDENGRYVRPTAAELLQHPFLEKRSTDDDEVVVDPPLRERAISEYGELGSQSSSGTPTNFSTTDAPKKPTEGDQVPETVGRSTPPPPRLVRTDVKGSLDEDLSDKFDEMPQTESNMKRVKVLMGRGQELEDDESPTSQQAHASPSGEGASVHSQAGEAAPSATTDHSAASLPATREQQKGMTQKDAQHYLVAAAVLGNEGPNVRPYPDDVLKLVVTLPVEGQNQNVQFDFHLVQDDPVQVAKEMVQELGIPQGAVLEISETISGLARTARMRVDKFNNRMQQQQQQQHSQQQPQSQQLQHGQQQPQSQQLQHGQQQLQEQQQQHGQQQQYGQQQQHGQQPQHHIQQPQQQPHHGEQPHQHPHHSQQPQQQHQGHHRTPSQQGIPLFQQQPQPQQQQIIDHSQAQGHLTAEASQHGQQPQQQQQGHHRTPSQQGVPLFQQQQQPPPPLPQQQIIDHSQSQGHPTAEASQQGALYNEGVLHQIGQQASHQQPSYSVEQQGMHMPSHHVPQHQQLQQQQQPMYVQHQGVAYANAPAPSHHQGSQQVPYSQHHAPTPPPMAGPSTGQGGMQMQPPHHVSHHQQQQQQQQQQPAMHQQQQPVMHQQQQQQQQPSMHQHQLQGTAPQQGGSVYGIPLQQQQQQHGSTTPHSIPVQHVPRPSSSPPPSGASPMLGAGPLENGDGGAAATSKETNGSMHPSPTHQHSVSSPELISAPPPRPAAAQRASTSGIATSGTSPSNSSHGRRQLSFTGSPDRSSPVSSDGVSSTDDLFQAADPDLQEELRKLEEDFQRNLQRTKKVFDNRMDNLQRSQIEREVQHKKTLEKHEKERLEFERRLAQEEEQQNRRIEQLQREWEKKRETLAKRNMASEGNAAPPPDYGGGTNGIITSQQHHQQQMEVSSVTSAPLPPPAPAPGGRSIPQRTPSHQSLPAHIAPQQVPPVTNVEYQQQQQPQQQLPSVDGANHLQHSAAMNGGAAAAISSGAPAPAAPHYPER